MISRSDVWEHFAAPKGSMDHNLNAPQPQPQPSASRPVWDLVIEDMQARDAVGRQRYGTPLQADNGRDHLVDAYQEALDKAVYLRALIAQRDEHLANGKCWFCNCCNTWRTP